MRKLTPEERVVSIARRRKYNVDYRRRNLRRLKQLDREYYIRDRAHRLASARLSRLQKYGLTPESWTALFAGQGRKCASCGSTEPGTTWGWHTDHDHQTGRVRGILCLPCNVLAGCLQSEKFDSVYRYLHGTGAR